MSKFETQSSKAVASHVANTYTYRYNLNNCVILCNAHSCGYFRTGEYHVCQHGAKSADTQEESQEALGDR